MNTTWQRQLGTANTFRLAERAGVFQQLYANQGHRLQPLSEAAGGYGRDLHRSAGVLCWGSYFVRDLPSRVMSLPKASPPNANRAVNRTTVMMLIRRMFGRGWDACSTGNCSCWN